jgi:hypothetical protein
MKAKSLLNKLRYIIPESHNLCVKESTNPISLAAEQFKATLTQDILWSLNGRFERGVALVANGAVSHETNPDFPALERLYRVQSANATKPPYSYLVDLDGGMCECPDHAKGHFCKHRIAAHIIELAHGSPVEQEAESPKESIIWGVIRHQEEWLGVEVLSTQDDQATVRALPRIVDGKKLQPRFPFEGNHSVTVVPWNTIAHIKVFQ